MAVIWVLALRHPASERKFYISLPDTISKRQSKRTNNTFDYYWMPIPNFIITTTTTTRKSCHHRLRCSNKTMIAAPNDDVPANLTVRKSAVAVAVSQKIGYWNWRPSIYHIHMWPCRHFAIWRRLRVRLRHHRHCRATHGSNQLYLHTTVQNVAATNSKQNCR